MAAVCSALLLAPAAARADDADRSHGTPALQGESLSALDYSLDPVSALEKTIDPAFRVTVTASEWQLYAVWDGSPTAVTASVSRAGAGNWLRLSSVPVLLAWSAARDATPHKTGGDTGRGKGKGGDKSKNTVIDFGLRLRLGADGVDPWTVRPGAYPGRIRFELRTRNGCDTVVIDPTKDGAASSDASHSAETSPAADASPTAEASTGVEQVPIGPATVETTQDVGITPPSAESSEPASPATRIEYGDEAQVAAPEVTSAPAADPLAESSVEATRTTTAIASVAGAPSSPARAGGGATAANAAQVECARPARHHPPRLPGGGDPIELAKPPDRPSAPPTATVEPSAALLPQAP